jgi:chaperonin GroES
MNLRPLHDRVIIQRIDDPAPPPGAIIVPDSAKEKPQHGTVIAVGSGKSNADGRRAPLDVKAGDTILFGTFAGQEIKLDGVEYLILKEEEVLGAIVSPTSSTEVTR